MSSILQELQTSYYGVWFPWTRYGQRIDNFPESTITSVAFYLAKGAGSPSGTAYARVREATGDAILGTLGTLDVSTLTQSPAWVVFTDPVVVPSTQHIRVTFEYEGGDSDNWLKIGYYGVDVCDGWSSGYYYYGGWSNYSGSEMMIRLYWTVSSLSKGNLGIVQTRLHYVDYLESERYLQGVLVEASSKPKGTIWIDHLSYASNMEIFFTDPSLNKRRVRGIIVGPSSKTKGDIFIKGIQIRYIGLDPELYKYEHYLVGTAI